MQQTSKYQFNLVEGSDDFSPAPLNQNMEKVEEELEGIEESLATVMESVDGHKIAVGSYRGSGGTKNVNLGFTPVAVWIHNRRIDSTLGTHSAVAVTGSAAHEQYGTSTMVTIIENGFQVIDGTNSSMNSSAYTYNYVAIC